MSVVRLSHLPVAHADHPAGVYATDDIGNLADAPLPDVPKFLDAQVKDKAAAQPVVVMVHGFWYDPASKVEKEQRSENPHDLNFHFSDAPQKQWRHTASWPLGLGFKKDDGGENGLAVAFAWDSTPDAFRFGTRVGRRAWLRSLATTFTPPPGVALPDHLAALGTEFGDAADALGKLPDSPAVRVLAKALKTVADDAANLRTPGPLALAGLFGGLSALGQETSAAVLPVIDVVTRHTPAIYKQAYDRAPEAGKELAGVFSALAEHAKLAGRPIDVFCHSLGSRVVLSALKVLAETGKAKALDRIDRVLIVGGSEYGDEAVRVLKAVQNVPGITPPDVYNFVGRRDRVLTHLAAHNLDLVDPPKSRFPVGAFGLALGTPMAVRKDAHWLDLALDAPPLGHVVLNKWLDAKRADEKRAWGEELGVKADVNSSHPLGLLNHWAYFTRAANMKFFAAIVREADRGGGKWSIGKMRKDGVPEA